MKGLDRVGGGVLSTGVTASSVCLAIGLVLAILSAGPAARVFLNLGFVVLLATPAARLVVSIVEYAIERDWLFLALAAIVLLELAAGLVAAIYGRRL